MSFPGTPPQSIAITDSNGTFNGGTYEKEYTNSGNSEVRYNLHQSDGTSFASGRSDIWFKIVNGALTCIVQDANDINTEYEPYLFSVGSNSVEGDGVATGTVSVGDVLKLWHTAANPTQYMGKITVPTQLGSASAPLSSNDLIENAYFVKNSDSSIALGFDWENITSYKVWVNRGGTITSSEAFLTGSSGTITGYTGAGVNALISLGEGDTVWLTKGNGDFSIVDGLGSIANPYVHKVVVWSKDSEKVYAKCFGDVTFSGGQSSAGSKATRLRGGNSYGSYQSPTTNEITHELPRGLGKYQIELWTVTSGNPTSYVDYGTFFRDSSQVSQNFW